MTRDQVIKRIKQEMWIEIRRERSNMAPDIREPLHVKRDAVIRRLEESLQKEKTKREEEDAKQRDARIAVNQFVFDHADEIVGFLGIKFGFTNWKVLLDEITEHFDKHDYKPVALKKSPRENDLEKFVRVLHMATNDTLEITPNEPIYDLL